ncbi:uncharacterized protein LOC106012463 [Aplysia californica]|uniref:Uncharacterized protein LOC106012463 n=1 Tax=Aplysia californica TaxID=6500 RepID=A0ABM1A514_APLCA|nr:uncharacterized protein LOC106012463 [Aplysia californica]
MRASRIARRFIVFIFVVFVFFTGFISLQYDVDIDDDAVSKLSIRRKNRPLDPARNHIRSLMMESEKVADEGSKFGNFRNRFKKWQPRWLSARVKLAAEKNITVDETRYVIYRCDQSDAYGCRDWAELVQGMTQTYVVSTLAGRRFKAELVNFPCTLEDFVSAAVVQWTHPVTFHHFLRTGLPGVGILDYPTGSSFYQQVSTTNFSQLMPDALAYMYFRSEDSFLSHLGDSDLYRSKQLAWMQGMNQAQVHAILDRRLFKLSPRMQRHLDLYLYAILPSEGHRLICLDISSSPYDVTQQEAGPDDSVLRKVWNFVLEHSKTQVDKIYLRTDYPHVRHSASRQSFARSTVHKLEVTRSTSHLGEAGATCERLEHGLIDHYIMRNCDVLLVSGSQLGRLAAAVRASDEGLFCLMANGHIHPCNTKGLSDLFVAHS